jgi:hypothetical protein
VVAATALPSPPSAKEAAANVGTKVAAPKSTAASGVRSCARASPTARLTLYFLLCACAGPAAAPSAKPEAASKVQAPSNAVPPEAKTVLVTQACPPQVRGHVS